MIKKISFLNNISEGASSLSWSILAGILKNKRRQFIFESEKAGLSEADYFRWVGYAYSAPLALCFAAYIEKIASKEKVRQILCVARDGFFLKKALDFFKRYCGARDFESSYLYASRAVCKSLLEDDERARLDYIKYLSRNKVDLNVPSIVVDTGTLNFSAQRALQKVFNSEILGVYFNVFAEADIDRANALKFFDFSAGLNRNIYPWDFLEFLISSPELPVESLDSGGNPVYKSNPDAAEIQRSKWIGEMNKGFEDFFHDCKDLCLMVSPSPVDIVKWINDLSFNPDNFDWQFLSKLKHTGNSQHQDYIPLFWCGKWKAWESLGAYRKRIKRSPWKTNIQRFIWKPILFELRSNGFSLVLNPRSTTVFCRLSFCLFGFNVKIAIGGVS